jgi:methionyl-tRNA formyltransferase
MKIALCSCDFVAPLHHNIREAGHTVTHVFTSCPLESGWSTQIHHFAQEMNAQFVVGAVTKEHIQQLKNQGVELLISAAYDYKIPVPNDESIKCINFHSTLLPQGRGPWPAPYILLKHPEAAGLTIHSMTDTWDFGDILLQEKISINHSDDSDSLAAKTLQLYAKLSKKLFKNFDKIWAERIPMTSQGEYWQMPPDAERTITPHDEPLRITEVFRAFGQLTLFSDGVSPPSPINKVVVWQDTCSEPVGTLIAINNILKIYAIRGGFLGVYTQRG